MRWNDFARSLLFAALAAAGAAAWLILTAPFLGARTALVAWLVGVTAAYLGGLAPGRRAALGAALASLLVGCGLALATRTLTELAIGLAILVAAARSGCFFRTSFARAVVLEALLVGAGLLFARFLAAGSPGGVVLALWGFFLVQSVYFLVGGIPRRRRAGARSDPFEEACARATALLDA